MNYWENDHVSGERSHGKLLYEFLMLSLGFYLYLFAAPSSMGHTLGVTLTHLTIHLLVRRGGDGLSRAHTKNHLSGFQRLNCEPPPLTPALRIHEALGSGFLVWAT